MLSLTGKLINIFTQPKGVNKDGEEYGGQSKVQIMGEVSLPDGSNRVDMYTLTAHNIRDFSECIDKQISVAIGVLASGKNVIFFIPKNTKPLVL